MRTIFLAIVLTALCSFAYARSYDRGDKISVEMNSVRPFNNPAETYDFYSLPFCRPARSKVNQGNFGDSLAGDRRKKSMYEFRFKTKVELQTLCSITLDQNGIKAFRDAIDRNFIFEMFIDNLPVMGFIGAAEDIVYKFNDHDDKQKQYSLFTHLDFKFMYNVDVSSEHGHVIAVNVTTSRSTQQILSFGSDLGVEFTYSSSWVHTPVRYENRLSLHQPRVEGDKVLEIHWLSIINSFVLVILLTTFLSIILMRILKNDFSRYMDADAEELGAEIDDSGWKQVHGDVFRSPDYSMVLSALVGTGTQLLLLSIGLLCLLVLGMFQPGYETSLYSYGVLLYSATSGIAGYVSTDLYNRLGGDKWATTACLTAFIFNGPLFLVFVVLNSIALSYESTSALPFSVIAMLVMLWAAVTLPLSVYGAMKAKRENNVLDPPCKTNFVRREIPKAPFYRRSVFQMFMAGFLPSSAIYVEIHYIFSSIWGNKVYTLFPLLALAFILLLIVTSFIVVSLTYLQLATEDYRWWWSSFAYGGSAGFFIYCYAIFFFWYRSQMSGILQTAYYFGYSLMISYAFVLMLGAIGFFSSFVFVKKIYASIKSD